MIIKKRVLEPEVVNELVDSNNSFEKRFEIITDKIKKLEVFNQKLMDEQIRKRSSEY